MPDPIPTAQGSAATVPVKFKDMNFFQKCAFIGKAIICVVTFGFAYPNIFSDL